MKEIHFMVDRDKCIGCETCVKVCPGGILSLFELLCAFRGLGMVMMTFPLGALEQMPKIKAMLEIPKEHYIGMLIGFGHPQIRYARGIQKTIDENRIHRPKI